MPSLLLLIILFLAGLFGNSLCYGFEVKGQDCSQCHTLTSSEARDLIGVFYPDVKILEVGMSPVKGSWELFIETGQKKGLVYIDFSKKYVLLGSILSIQEKRNLTQERLSQLNKVDVSQIPLDDAVVMGDSKARIRVIVFTDPD